MEWLTENERALLDNHFNIDFCNGQNNLLDDYMKKKRRERLTIPPYKTHMLFQNYTSYQIWFQTPPCRYSLQGKCTVCNYWNGSTIPNLMDTVLPKLKLPSDSTSILINTCGSCLDQHELPKEELEKLLKWIAESSANQIIFETHASTLAEPTLEYINTVLGNKEIYYEIGAESANEDTLFYCLNKPPLMKQFHQILNRIHKYHAQCIVNIMFGAPFLNAREQIDDTIASLQYFIQEGADFLTLFPLNIKPNTLLEDLFKQNRYRRVPVKMLAEILLMFPEDYLEKINVAWYGDHKEEGVIPPIYCEKCGADVLRMFNEFNYEPSKIMRREILERIIHIPCKCNDAYKDTQDNRPLYGRIFEFYDYIKRV